MAEVEVMNVKTLISILSKIDSKFGDFEIWLSKDEEGNEFMRMLRNTSLSLAIDNDQKQIIFFPSWFPES